ncbi:MAG: hypothetical protein R6U93_04665 [Dehalococcoidia bacterium]
MKALEPWLFFKSIKNPAEWWLRFALPVAAIILAIYSMGVSSIQLQLAQRAHEITVSHYFESEEPASQYRRISLDLIRLDSKIEQAEQWIAQSDMPKASVMELEQALYEAKHWREETDKALFEYRLTDAEGYRGLGHESVDEVLRELSEEVFALPVVTVWSEGFLSVGIDNLTTGMTREGETLETVTIVIADPPISSRYPYRVISCYDISPNRARLDDPATFTFGYDPDDIPFGFHEEDLVGATWNWDTEEWSVIHDSKIHLQENSISVTMNHLSYFAVIAQYPKLTQPIGWIAITAVVLGLSLLVAFGVAIANRRQQSGRRPLTCRVRKHQWFPRVPTPKQYPRRRSRDWNGR